MYHGKEICQGCKKSAEIKPRQNKTDLCTECDQALKVGQSVNKETLTEYTLLRDWYNGFSSIDWMHQHPDASLDKLANEILEALHNPVAKTSQTAESPRAQAMGSKFYNIPTSCVAPICNFFKAANDEVFKIKGIKEAAEAEARKAVSVEKNKIFNEGVEKGRELLFSLNNGDLTMDEFSKNITKY